VSNTHDLRIMSQNLFVHYFVFNSYDKTQRLEAFCNALPTLDNVPDVVLMQEVFEVKVGPVTLVEPAVELIRNAASHGFIGCARGTSAMFGQNNGLLMFSKYHMSNTKAYTFANRAEHICAKGILHSVVQLKDSITQQPLSRPVHFLTAHLDSRGAEMKRLQLMELRAHFPPLFEPDGKTPTSIVVAGDLNVDGLQPDLYQMLCSILCPSGELIDAHPLPYSRERDITCEEDRMALDYLFVSPHLLSSRDDAADSGARFVIEKIHTPGKDGKPMPVSDHWGVSCTIRVPLLGDSSQSVVFSYEATPAAYASVSPTVTAADLMANDPVLSQNSSTTTAATAATAIAACDSSSASPVLSSSPGPISLRASQDGLFGSPMFDAHHTGSGASGSSSTSSPSSSSSLNYGMVFQSNNPKFWSDFICARNNSAPLGWQKRVIYSRLDTGSDPLQYNVKGASTILQATCNMLLVFRNKSLHVLSRDTDQSYHVELRDLSRWSSVKHALLLPDGKTILLAQRNLFHMNIDTLEPVDISSHMLSSILHPIRILLESAGKIYAISNKLNAVLDNGKLSALKFKSTPWAEVTNAVFFPPNSTKLIATLANGKLYYQDIANERDAPLIWSPGTTITNMFVISQPKMMPRLFAFSTNWLYQILIENGKVMLEEVCFAAWGTVSASCVDVEFYKQHKRHRVVVASDICLATLILPLEL
jgi:endonuclease/exonuclease/phosphatase family metal-dependent hydrolase